MSISYKKLLMYVILGTLGLTTIIKTASANQTQPPTIKPSFSQTQSQPLQKISARDGEADENQENQEQFKNQQQTKEGDESDENEANEGPNDGDSGSQEDAK